MDLATLTNAPREITLGGTPYTVSALTAKEWGGVQAWLKDHVPGPIGLLDSTAMGNLSPGHQRQLLEVALRAQRNWPPAIASSEWFDALIRSEGGEARFVHAVLAKHRPGLTIEEAAAIAGRMDAAESTLLTRRALGLEDPPPLPKASPPTTTGGETTTGEAGPDTTPTATTGPASSTP